MLENDTHVADNIVRFGEGLRGSCQFWYRRQSELSDMIKQLGTRGMVFFTFSAADFHWPDLHNLMPHGSSLGELSEQEASTCRRQDLIENPHITAWYFERRFKLFLKRCWSRNGTSKTGGSVSNGNIVDARMYMVLLREKMLRLLIGMK